MILIQLRDFSARLPDFFNLFPFLALGLDLLQLLLALLRGRVHDTLLEAEHVALAEFLDNVLGFFDAHLAKDLIDLVQRLRFQGIPQVLGEGGEDIACRSIVGILTLLGRDVDCDFRARIDGV